jgi:DNA-binding LacI/PurR family transcriptional regulator
VEWARYIGLTTVRVPMRAMGERAAQLLLEALARRSGGTGNEVVEPEHITLRGELVVRGTCGERQRR